MGQPPSIDDSYVDVGEPTPVDDDRIGPNGLHNASAGQSAPNTLIAFIPVVRAIYQLKKTLKARSVTSATLKIYDEHFKSIMDSLPDPFPITSTTPLDPALLHPALCLHIARFFLYRHNLSIACRPHERKDALDRCVQVAKDTAYYIWRSTPAAMSPGQPCIHPPDMSNSEWRSRIRVSAPIFLCTHFWRCTLVLSLCAEYGPALTCLGAMSAVGEHRKINIACGRNLAFFFDRLVERIQSGQGSTVRNNEEMLAYASADLQGDQDNAWAWTGGEVGPGRGLGQGQDMRGFSVDPGQGHAQGYPHHQQHPTVLLTKEEEQEWGGWEKIEGILQQLHHGASGFPQYQAENRQQPPPMHQQSYLPMPPQTNAPTMSRPPHLASTQQSARISIKDIM